jgi:hypothetical protein
MIKLISLLCIAGSLLILLMGLVERNSPESNMSQFDSSLVADDGVWMVGIGGAGISLGILIFARNRKRLRVNLVNRVARLHGERIRTREKHENDKRIAGALYVGNYPPHQSGRHVTDDPVEGHE